MAYPELWHSIMIEAAATFALTLLAGLATYAYRMWQLPKLQAETIAELRQLRIAIGQLSEQFRKDTPLRHGDFDNA